MKRYIAIIMAVILSGCYDLYEQEIQTKNEDSFVARATESGNYYYGAEGRVSIVRSSDKSYVLFKADATELQITTAIKDAQGYDLIPPQYKENAKILTEINRALEKSVIYRTLQNSTKSSMLLRIISSIMKEKNIR